MAAALEIATNLNINFDQLSYQDALTEIQSIKDPRYLVARSFYEGDHWQRGDAWVGPHPGANDDAAQVWKDIERQLVPHPAIEEVVNRHRDAIIGQEPFWGFTPRRAIPDGEEPTQEEKDLIQEAEAQLTAWWDSKEPLEVLQLAIEDLCLGGRGLVRLFIPSGELQSDADGVTTVPEGEVSEQLDRIWCTFIEADSGAVPRDPLTMQKFGIFMYEVQDMGNNATTKFAEFTYLEPKTKKTVIRSVVESGGATPPTNAKLDLGGRLTMYEMRSHPLISEPIIANQKLLNKSLTMRSNNIDLGGFLERTILNGQLPGEYEDDGQGGKKFVPDKFEVGAGTTNQIVGVQIGVTPEGNAIIAEPRIQYRDPVDVTCFDKTELAAYKNVLTGTRQLHVLISGDANASGEARKQARDDFTKSLKRTKTRLDAAGRSGCDLCGCEMDDRKSSA